LLSQQIGRRPRPRSGPRRRRTGDGGGPRVGA